MERERWSHGSHIDAMQRALLDIGWIPQYFAIHIITLDPTFAGRTCDSFCDEKIEKNIYKKLVPELKAFREKMF